MFETAAADGTNVQAHDEGAGRVILIVHPGLDEGSGWAEVAGLLASDYRVLRLRRRQYRFDIGRTHPATIAEEVRDVAAVASAIGEPTLIVGHSSGGVVSLESLLDRPSAYAGAVIYEAPVVTDLPLGSHEANATMKAASDAGKLGKAIQIFTRDVVGVKPLQALAIRAIIVFARCLRKLVPRQVDDSLAISTLGNRLKEYQSIATPVLLLGGDRSPAHLGKRLDSLEAAIPGAERVTIVGHGHSANASAPAELARIVSDFAGRVF
jgi:pimeloyl-ACP methyl ester carboxylesterase